MGYGMGWKRGAWVGAGVGLIAAGLAELVIWYGAARAGVPFAVNVPFALSIVLPCAALGAIIGCVRRRRRASPYGDN